ncbi:uncharacterized protein LOC143300933 isoform X2 [Babylonia areolata]|uniref:uncharacterized protein LOC143300933 isoform X2 n=1 Tax=Babylonia areolata TaxID=304850 RepID=UPI003FD6AD0B
MSNFPRMEVYSTVNNMATLSRTQEKLELQQLNDRFASYVHRVRLLAEKNNQVDSSAIIKSTKAMEMEIQNLKNMYEQELEKLRKELELCNHERTTIQVQANKQVQCSSELQDRLNVEMDKCSKLQDEINMFQRRIGGLEAEIQELKIAATQPRGDMEQLQRSNTNMARELEALKHRYEHEQVARQEAETRIQQLMEKSSFNEKVSAQRVGELTSRIDVSAATILSLEAKIRDLSKADISVSEMLKQVRDAAEAELKKYQVESDEQYNKNLTALKSQLDNYVKLIEKLEAEKAQLGDSVGELQARIRTLEGQVANLEHQRVTLEAAVATERNRAADGARALEQKLREVQGMLVVKMKEVTSAREQYVPLKAEIESLKVLLEEEEKRLRVPMVTISNTTQAVPGGEPMTEYNTAFATNSSLVANVGSSHAADFPYTSTSGSFSLPPAPHNTVSFGEITYPYMPPSPPLSLTYVPEVLQPTGTSLDPMFCFPQYGDELDPQLFGYSGTLTQDRFTSEGGPGLNRVSMEPSPPTTPRPSGPTRNNKSAPVALYVAGQKGAVQNRNTQGERHRNLNLVRSDQGQGHDYFDKMFQDLQQDTLYSQGRSRGQQNEQPSSSVYHDYTVSTSSATGNMKIAEVHQEGKYVRLVNEGSQELDLGGFTLQQNVGGHPVAMFRFPPRTRFAPNSLVTVYAGCSDRSLHQPPQDFVWKEQQKWGSGPECTTILCKPNGQAVAWTTAAHRFMQESDTVKNESKTVTIMGENWADEGADDDSLAVNASANAKTETAMCLRREKQQPPSLQTSGNVYSHGVTQSYQSSCPDLVPVQKTGGSSQRKYVSGVSTQQHSVIRGNGKSGDGGVCGEQSPFTVPHAQFQSGLDLDLLQSQHAPHFLPPVPRPPLSSAW